MREYLISKNDAGQRADRFLRKAAPDLPASAIQKAFRLRDVKRAGKRCRPDERLEEGDIVRIYVSPPSDNTENAKPWELEQGTPDIVYEDENIIVLHKPAGLCSQSEGAERSLENLARAYLYRKNEWLPENENAFAPSLCHRLDRGTEGLVLCAKTASALRILTEKIRLREIRKVYHAVIRGIIKPDNGVLRDYLYKDPVKSLVTVHPDRTRGAKTAVLEYKTLEKHGDTSLVEIELHTGRTHQIRVQFASRGHAIIGDGKYGASRGEEMALRAVKLELCFKTNAAELDYLKGRIFEIDKKT